MEKIAFGKTDLQISPLIFGGNVFGWTLDEKESFKILDKITEIDINCIDTADVYSRWVPNNVGGESETIIGKWMKQRNNRENLIICTKTGIDIGQGGIDISAKHILSSVEKSLKRLQTDYIDLYYAHKDDEKTPPEETLEAFQKLIDQGKVRHIGASNFSAERLEESLKISEKNNLPKYKVLQPEYNLLTRKEFEENKQKLCEKYGLGVATYFSLASGVLTGKYENESDIEKSSRTDQVKKYWNEKTFKVLEKLKTVSENHNTSQAAVSLAWIMQNPNITAPIVSATKQNHLAALKDAVSIKLSSEETKLLNNVSS